MPSRLLLRMHMQLITGRSPAASELGIAFPLALLVGNGTAARRLGYHLRLLDTVLRLL